MGFSIWEGDIVTKTEVCVHMDGLDQHCPTEI